jgi:hypothetical protein
MIQEDIEMSTHDSTSRNCRRCRRSVRATLAAAPEPHYGKLVCSRCGQFLAWAPWPMTTERALAFRMPLGEHQGSTLGDICETTEGRASLRDLLQRPSVKGSMRLAIEAALAATRPAKPWGPPPARTTTPDPSMWDVDRPGPGARPDSRP